MDTARGRRFALPVLSAALMFTGTLIGSVAAAPVAAAAVPDEVADVAGAEKLAKQSGKSIVIGAETTETSQVKANPDGTRTLTTYTHPVRVKRDKNWAAVDLTLEKKPDGSIAPKVAPVSMVFTAGGRGSAGKPTAKLVKDAAEVGFGWDSDLPEARISGDTVTYPEVMPGVDLELKAALTGFSQNLVVKNPEVAKNPKLKTVKFKSHTKNTKISKAGTGTAAKSAAASFDGLVVTGNDGKQVFAGDASRMWDSTEGEPRGAVMGVDVGADSIVITPDQQFLADSKTKYPVRIDPDYYCNSCSKAHHAVVQTPWPNARNYDVTSGQLGDLKAGYLNANSLNAPTAGISRTYFQMSTSQIGGKYIKSATLHAKVIGTYSCSPTPTELWQTAWFDQNITWNNQPGWTRWLSENNTRNNPGHCPTDGGADFNAKQAVIDASNGAWPITTFMFKARDENSLDASWRRFDLNPYLEVVYNSAPSEPSDLGIEGWGPNRYDAIPCVVGANRPVVGTRNPRLRARLSDPDGGMLNASFRVLLGATPNYTWNKVELWANNVPSGSFAEIRVPDGWVADGSVYTYHLKVDDGDPHLVEGWSRECEFTIDTVKPNTPAVSSTDYPASGINGSVGRTGNFTLSPNGNTGTGGTMDVVRYGWSLNNNTFENFVKVDSANGAMTVPITPIQSGTNVLYVQAYDKAGNPAMESKKYVFNVADPAGPVGAWNFDETGGNTAADISGKNHPLTLNNASFGSGYSNNGQVNTTSSFSQTSTSLVDTSRAFSVSTWVKLDRADGFYSVASQDGNRGSGFYLQYSKDVNRWNFSATTADSDDAGWARTFSNEPPQVGVWTHLLGTYEPNTHKMALYVNGKLNQIADATLWNATGPFVVGASKSMGTRINQLPGTIDHVQVWDRALSPDEAARHSNFAVLRAHYNLDERTGNVTKDEVSGQNGTLSGWYEWAGTPADPDDPNQVLSSRDKWVNLDAASQGSMTGPRPANFRTDRSYTVSTWVKHNGAFSVPDTAFAMGDSSYSPFLLCYRPETGKWGFLQSARPDGGSELVVSDNPAETDKWVHLAGVYDATTGTMSLYVNGTKQAATKTGQGAFNASGDLWLGRAVWNGQRTDGWKGDIDDARVYSGALSDSDVRDMYRATLHR